MKEKKEMDIETFIEMFVAVSYLQEQRIFSQNFIQKFIANNYSKEKENYSELKYEADLVLNKMAEDGILDIIYHQESYGVSRARLFRITDKIDYKNIIMNNHDDLEYVIKLFYSMYGGEWYNVDLVSKESFQKK